jgi:hypothetical protein
MHMKCLLKALLPALASLGAAYAWADTDRLAVNTPRYDQEYPAIGYSGPATHNRVWRLKQQLESGAVKLTWEPKQGYLRSLLHALDISVDSQVLVFSKTSLQTGYISEKTPRAIYFNDDTYVGWIQGSTLIEFTVIDAEAGVVFFGLENRRDAPAHFEREGGRCLTCHDTYSMMGGGVPRVLAMSAPVDDPADTRAYSSASEVDDRTPIEKRWGGWYVTGRHGAADHLGNLPLRESGGGEKLRKLQPARANLQTLAAYFDTADYLSDKSDIAALLVLEHQAYVQNLITRANYKVRSLMSRGRDVSAVTTWAGLGAQAQAQIRPIVESVVRGIFLADAAPVTQRIEGNSGFTERFSRTGPLDSKGRTLRELDLTQRLLRYPLSYLVYSEHFNALPPYLMDYINLRIAEVLQGRDTTGLSARISAADRAAITQILIDTAPRLASRL